MSCGAGEPGKLARRWLVVQTPLEGGTIAFPVIAAMLHLGTANWGTVGAVARVVGALLILTGVLLFRAAKRQLGTALVATPKPVDGASLRTEGVYAHLRHPIYAGLIVGTFGWALVWNSAVGAGLALLCAVFFGAKLRYEERLLHATFEGYEEYCRVVPGLVPEFRRRRV